MMNRILLSIFLCVLSGCSTSIKYTKWNGTDQLESTALKFQLQDSSLTLAGPSAAVPGAAVTSPVAPGKSNCPDGVTKEDWGRCFSQVAPHAAIAPPASGQIYVAKPHDFSHLWLSTTAISGVVVTGQDTLYSQVTIKYTNNISAVIAGAATGAVAGFGIAGPYGAAAGFAIGAFAAGIPALARPSLKDYICKNEPVDLLSATADLKPVLYLPLTINAADARPIAPSEKLESLGNMKPAMCWHTLPNTSHLGEVLPFDGNTPSTKVRGPVSGDGWLYRLVAADGENPTKEPKGAIETEKYFSSSDARQDFPYSACRNVTVQLTWWKDLSDAIEQANKPLPSTPPSTPPRVVTFKTVVADPAYVFEAKVKKGGVINFKPDCGANVSLTADTSSVATINAIITATQNIYKAEQTWESNQKKKP